MRWAAPLLVASMLGCYPSSELDFPIVEHSSAIILGSDGNRSFASASRADRIAVPFTSGRDLVLEAHLYFAPLEELGVAEGPLVVSESGGRPPPRSATILRTTVTDGEFSGWEEVSASGLSIEIPFFEAAGCSGCIGADDLGNPLCKSACTPSEPLPPTAPAPPQLTPIAPPPECPPEQVAYVGETACHPFTPCAADGWPTAEADAFVRPGAAGGDGRRDTPYGTISEALSAGAIRVALASGTHELDGELDRPLELLGACAAETILIAVLRTTAPLSVSDLTIMGGIETSADLDVRRLHLHGGPLLADTATVTGGDLALHDAHLVINRSHLTLERLFVSSDLHSFSCGDSDATIDNAVLTDGTGHTANLAPNCRATISRAVLRPFDTGVAVDRDAELHLSDAFIEALPDGEGGITVLPGGFARVDRVEMIGDDGLDIRGSAEAADSIVTSTDQDSGGAIECSGRMRGERLVLMGSKRGVSASGQVDLQDVAIQAAALGVYTQLNGGLSLERATIGGRVQCVQSQGEFVGRDLALSGCEIGVSSSESVEIERMTIAPDVVHGVVISGGSTTISDVRIAAYRTGVEANPGELTVSRFLIEGAEVGAALREGTLSLRDGRLVRIDVGLVLPAEVRPEQVLREVVLDEVRRLTSE